jgi:hypothetical protein
MKRARLTSVWRLPPPLGYALGAVPFMIPPGLYYAQRG